jgi:thiol-disulfide isomerase/thioredoxin
MVEASDKKDFASLSAEEQTAMVTKINTILTENGLQNSVTVAHKAVMKGNIKEGEFSCKGGLTLKGNLSVSLEGAMNKAVD